MIAPTSDTTAAGNSLLRTVPVTSAVRIPHSSRCENVDAATKPNSTPSQSRKPIATAAGTTPTRIDHSV